MLNNVCGTALDDHLRCCSAQVPTLAISNAIGLKGNRTLVLVQQAERVLNGPGSTGFGTIPSKSFIAPGWCWPWRTACGRDRLPLRFLRHLPGSMGSKSRFKPPLSPSSRFFGGQVLLSGQKPSVFGGAGGESRPRLVQHADGVLNSIRLATFTVQVGALVGAGLKGGLSNKSSKGWKRVSVHRPVG